MTEPAPEDAVDPGPKTAAQKPKPKVEPLGDGWQVVLYVGDQVAGRSGSFRYKAEAERAKKALENDQTVELEG
jgi:hypothetical protein